MKFIKPHSIALMAALVWMSLPAQAEVVKVAIRTNIIKFENAGPYSENIGLTKSVLYGSIKKSLERKGYRVVNSSAEATDGITFSVEVSYGQNCCGTGDGPHGYAVSVGYYILGKGSFKYVPTTKEVALAWGSGIAAAGGPSPDRDELTRALALKIIDGFIDQKF